MGQHEEIKRVKERIGPLVLEFYGAHPGEEFHAEDLLRYVRQFTPAAPGSPDRVMRALSKEGQLSYEVLDRSSSLYRFPARPAMKPFTWSWSRLKNYRSCPKRSWHIDINKDVAEPESEALKWGHEVHTAMAETVAKGVHLPRTMQHYDAWPKKLLQLKRAGMRTLVENKLAMAEDFSPTGFFDQKTWFRGVLDVIGFGTRRALSVDWKTGGNISPDYEQLGLSAQLVFAHYPDIDEVDTAFVWLGHTHDDGTPVTTKETYKRDGMVPLWSKLMPEVKAMAEAYRTVTYPPRPSGLCVKHCPVTSCPYHGKGSR